MTDVKCIPFHAIYTKYIRKKAINILLGSILILLLYQTPSKIKSIQNDLNSMSIDNDVTKTEGRNSKTLNYIKRQTKLKCNFILHQ